MNIKLREINERIDEVRFARETCCAGLSMGKMKVVCRMTRRKVRFKRRNVYDI